MTLGTALIVVALVVNVVLVVRELAFNPNHPGEPGDGEQW